MNFDPIIFLYALYVAFGYASLSFGATYFRNALDEQDREKIDFGETLLYIVNPTSYALLGILFVFFCIFAITALSISTPTVLAYTFPLALFINVLQLLYRSAVQKSELCTRGVILRHLFLADSISVPYDEIVQLSITPTMGWYRCELHVLPFEYKGNCLINNEQKNMLMRMLASNEYCEIQHH